MDTGSHDHQGDGGSGRSTGRQRSCVAASRRETKEIDLCYEQTFGSHFHQPLERSSMKLTIPKEEIGTIAELFTLSDEDRNVLLNSLREAEPNALTEPLTEFASKLRSVSEETRGRLLGVLLSLCNVAHGENLNIDSFVRNDVASAFASAGDERIRTDGPQWEKIRSFLTEALKTDLLSVTIKARGLVLSESHLFLSAQIVSDIRLVFSEDPSSLPSVGLVIHSLKLNYLEDGKNARAEFVLDREDLLELKKVIERALVKNQTLNKLLQQAEVRRVTPFVVLGGEND